MCAELECGVCYQAYNTSRRFPRELACRHTFCESCLSTMVRQSQAKTSEGTAHPGQAFPITCPLCRHSTYVPVGSEVRQALRVDEELLAGMLAAGFPGDDPGDEADRQCDVNDKGEGQESGVANLSLNVEPAAGTGTRKVRLWRSLKRMCGMLSRGNGTLRQRSQYMTNEELKDLALMSCYMV